MRACCCFFLLILAYTCALPPMAGATHTPGYEPPQHPAPHRSTLGVDIGSFTSRHTLVVLGAAAAATWWAWDETDENFPALRDGIDGSFIDPAADLGNTYGSSLFIGTASAGLLGFGMLYHHHPLRETGADLCRSFLYAQAVTGVIKHAVDRERPSGDPLSFPSGHTTAAWSVVPVAWHHAGWKGGLPTALMATLTALGRMEENRHFLSDVIAGGTIGYLVGRAVVADRGSRDGRLRLSAGPGGLMVSGRF